MEPEKSAEGFGDISYYAKATGSVINTLNLRLPTDTVSTVNVTWSSASVYVEKISFTGKGNNPLDTTITIEKNLNIFNADALAGVIKLPAASYKDVAVKMFCRKSMQSELAFYFKGTFINSNGGTDSVLVGSSLPFEANLAVTEIVIDASDKYKATFNFDLNKVLTGISRPLLESTRSHTGNDGKKTYAIFKGGSADEPFYDQVIENFQNVAGVAIDKEL
ncbi:hypothetical protein ACSBL2_14230 [Pedobacter sp. AW31-3R]|uniref:hypothetical protein n=1 Tax=Pedobacter sp. AW31-3R TaxID=3445781 RepID=UPI003F9EFACC